VEATLETLAFWKRVSESSVAYLVKFGKGSGIARISSSDDAEDGADCQNLGEGTSDVAVLGRLDDEPFDLGERGLLRVREGGS